MTDTSRQAEEAGIRAMLDSMVTALRGKDAEGVLRHFAPDCVHFDLAPPLQAAGPDAEGLNAWFATWSGPIGYSVHELATEIGDNIAFCHSLNRMSGTKTDGETVDLWFRHTLCLRRSGEAWQIAHEHDSVPFYMDGSYRAAVDLQPGTASIEYQGG